MDEIRDAKNVVEQHEIIKSVREFDPKYDSAKGSTILKIRETNTDLLDDAEEAERDGSTLKQLLGFEASPAWFREKAEERRAQHTLTGQRKFRVDIKQELTDRRPDEYERYEVAP